MNPAQLKLPLLETIHELGGRPKAGDVIEALAEKLGLEEELKNKTVYDPNGYNRTRYPLRQRIHWGRLALVHLGLLDRGEKGIWPLTRKGQEALGMAAPGAVVIIYETARGMALWAEAEASVGMLIDDSVDLFFSSPPYPLNNPREYGNRSEGEHIQWLVDRAKEWKTKMVDDGSLMLNLGSVWQPGQPCQSAWEERVLLALIDDAKFFLAQKLYWHNPVSLGNSPYITIKRVRVNSAVETIYWLGKTAHPKANNRRVLTPYKLDMLRRLQRGKKYHRSPSNHLHSKNPFGTDNGGAIPHNLIEASNTISNDHYMRSCRQAGLRIHPARFPREIVDFGVKLTTKPGNLVVDLTGGSAVTAIVAEENDCDWIVGDPSLNYVLGGGFRFNVPPTERALCAA